LLETLINIFSSVFSKPFHKIYDSISDSRLKKLDHEKAIFGNSNVLLEERELLYFLDVLQTDDAYFSNDLRKITKFCDFFREEGNQYIGGKLRRKCLELVNSLLILTEFLSLNFFVFPKSRQGPDFRLCLYPELNVDRAGSGNPSDMARYFKFQKELDSKIKLVRIAYRQYRAKIKGTLFI